MKNKKSIIVISVCAVLICATFIYVKLAPKNKGGFSGRGPNMTVPSVVTLKTQNTVLHDYVNTNGEIESQSSIAVYPDIGGKISRVFVVLGQSVKKGDLICEVDPSAPGAQYAKSPVYAPVSGTVTMIPPKEGTKVSTATTITNIGDVSNLQIQSRVPEKYVAALKPGLKAQVMLQAYPGEIFNATVVQVSPVVDSISRTKVVLLNFDKSDSRINAGMFAKVKLFTLDYSGAPIVPVSCITDKNGKNVVYVVDSENIVKQREVKTGNSVDGMIQILSGITEGEVVVTEGMRAVTDGSEVKVIR